MAGKHALLERVPREEKGKRGREPLRGTIRKILSWGQEGGGLIFPVKKGE